MHTNTCYGRIDNDLLTRLSSIKLVAFDVDGTITDGGIYYDNHDFEMKRFNCKDGFGVVALFNEGIETAVISSSFISTVTYADCDTKTPSIVPILSPK